MADSSNTRIPFRQLLLQYSNTALNIIFPLILFPYMTRTLGPTGYGIIGFYESLLFVVNVWAAFGVNYYGLRLLSKKAVGYTGHANTVLHLLFINLVMALIGVLGYFVYVMYKPVMVGGPEITLLYAYIMVIYMLHIDWYFQSQEKFYFLLKRTFFLRLFVLLTAFIFVKKPEHLTYYILISTINYTLIAASGIWNIRKLFNHWNWDPDLFRRLLIALWPFAALGILSSLYFTIDTILLARTGRITDLGYYTVAAKMVRLGLNVFVGASIVFFVKLFRSSIDKHLQADSMLMTLHLSIPIAAMLFFFAQPIVLFISGEDYLPSIGLLKIFSLLWVIVPLHDFFNLQVLLVHHRERLLVTIYLFATLVSLILNIILIPLYFTEGAAFSILITESLVLVMGIYFSLPYFQLDRKHHWQASLCFFAFPVAWCSWEMASKITPIPLLQIILGGGIFVAGYVILQVLVFRNDFIRRILRVIIKNKVRPTVKPPGY